MDTSLPTSGGDNKEMDYSKAPPQFSAFFIILLFKILVLVYISVANRNNRNIGATWMERIKNGAVYCVKKVGMKLVAAAKLSIMIVMSSLFSVSLIKYCVQAIYAHPGLAAEENLYALQITLTYVVFAASMFNYGFFHGYLEKLSEVLTTPSCVLLTAWYITQVTTSLEALNLYLSCHIRPMTLEPDTLETFAMMTLLTFWIQCTFFYSIYVLLQGMLAILVLNETVHEFLSKNVSLLLTCLLPNLDPPHALMPNVQAQFEPAPAA